MIVEDPEMEKLNLAMKDCELSVDDVIKLINSQKK
jgi:hypothetical protein